MFKKISTEQARALTEKVGCPLDSRCTGLAKELNEDVHEHIRNRINRASAALRVVELLWERTAVRPNLSDENNVIDRWLRTIEEILFVAELNDDNAKVLHYVRQNELPRPSKRKRRHDRVRQLEHSKNLLNEELFEGFVAGHRGRNERGKGSKTKCYRGDYRQYMNTEVIKYANRDFIADTKEEPGTNAESESSEDSQESCYDEDYQEYTNDVVIEMVTMDFISEFKLELGTSVAGEFSKGSEDVNDIRDMLEFIESNVPDERVELPHPVDFKEFFYRFHVFLRQIKARQRLAVEDFLDGTKRSPTRNEKTPLEILLTRDLPAVEAGSSFSVWVTQANGSSMKFFVPSETNLVGGLVIPCLCNEFFGNYECTPDPAAVDGDPKTIGSGARFGNLLMEQWGRKGVHLVRARDNFAVFHSEILGESWEMPRTEATSYEEFQYSDIVPNDSTSIDAVVAATEPTTLGKISVPFIYDENAFSRIPPDERHLGFWVRFPTVKKKKTRKSGKMS